MPVLVVFQATKSTMELVFQSLLYQRIIVLNMDIWTYLRNGALFGELDVEKYVNVVSKDFI